MVPRSPHALRAGCPVGAGAEHCRASCTAPRKPGQGYGPAYLPNKYVGPCGGNFASAKLNSPVDQCAKGCRWVLELVGRGRPWLCAAAAGLRRAAATWGVPHTPEGLAGGVACDEELPESGKWLYKLILNDSLKRLTLLMVLL